MGGIPFAVLVMITAFSNRAIAQAGWGICAFVVAFGLFLLLNVKRSWAAGEARISTERAERACDTILSICLTLIAAILAVLPILGDRVVGTSYLIPVGFALALFLALLVFTVHLRFNFLWRMRRSFIVSARRNIRFAFWLTTATSSLVLGIFLLAILAIALAVGWVRMK